MWNARERNRRKTTEKKREKKKTRRVENVGKMQKSGGEVRSVGVSSENARARANEGPLIKIRPSVSFGIVEIGTNGGPRARVPILNADISRHGQNRPCYVVVDFWAPWRTTIGARAQGNRPRWDISSILTYARDNCVIPFRLTKRYCFVVPVKSVARGVQSIVLDKWGTLFAAWMTCTGAIKFE